MRSINEPMVRILHGLFHIEVGVPTNYDYIERVRYKIIGYATCVVWYAPYM
jgi:hypothetical protein